MPVMELNIVEEKENALLERKELEFEIRHGSSSTPSKAEVVKNIAAKYSVPETHVLLNYLFTRKGTGVATGKAKVYQQPVAAKEAKREAGKAEAKPELATAPKA